MGAIEYWLVAAAAVAACALSILFHARRHRGETERGALVALLKTMRAAALVLAAALALSPVVSYDLTEHEKGKVLVLFDTSASMKFASKSGTRREEAARAAANSRLIELAGADNDLSFATFASSFKSAASYGEVMATPAEGNSDLTGALTEIMGRGDISSAVIFSDGQSTSDYPASQVARFIKVPVFTVGVGDSDNLRDASITDVSHPKICYKNEKTEITADISQTGLAGTKTMLVFRENGDVRERVPVSFDRDRISVRVSFEPKNEGLTRFDLELEPQAGEVSADNNRHPFFMNVTAHKIRVLYVESTPRQDFAFLKSFLSRNRDISCTARLLDSPLKGMKLEAGDAGRFDVLILGNIDFGSLEPALERTLFDAAAKNNAALLFLGGPAFSMPKKSLFHDLFPVRSAAGFAYEDSAYKPALTDAGGNHPITRLSPVSKINSFMWNDVPELCGFNYAAEAGAQEAGAARPPEVLIAARAVLKSAKNRQLEFPVLAVRSHLNKKCAAFMGASTWFLKFGQVSSKNSQFYDRFFGNILVWLYSRDESKPFSVETDRTNYFVDDAVYVSVYARNQDFSPMVNPAFTVSLSGAGGGRIPLEAKPAPVDSGYYEFAFKTALAGQYSLTVEATDERGRIEKGAARFITVNSARESLRVAPAFDSLREIAEKTGGKFFEAKNAGALPAELPKKSRTSVSRAEFRPAESPSAFWIVFLLLAAEWAIRRAAGFE